MAIGHISIPGFYCEYNSYSDFFGNSDYGDIRQKVRSRKSSIRHYGPGKMISCMKCGKYAGKITFYNHKDGKLCKDCFLEIKRLQKEEEGK